MGSRLLCCVALCLLGTGPAEAGVRQTPRHLVRARGQTANLTCSPVSGHLSVSWYQQVPGQGPQLLVEYYNGERRGTGSLPDRFSVRPLSDSRWELHLGSLEPGDAALYLCASSRDTAPQRP